MGDTISICCERGTLDERWSESDELLIPEADVLTLVRIIERRSVGAGLGTGS